MHYHIYQYKLFENEVLHHIVNSSKVKVGVFS